MIDCTAEDYVAGAGKAALGEGRPPRIICVLLFCCFSSEKITKQKSHVSLLTAPNTAPNTAVYLQRYELPMSYTAPNTAPNTAVYLQRYDLTRGMSDGMKQI